jgi:hypothetical protein
VSLFANPEDTCLSYNEHAVLQDHLISICTSTTKHTLQITSPSQKEIDDVQDFSACTSDNERKSLKAIHAHDQKT